MHRVTQEPPTLATFTVEEYFRLEADSVAKHEFFDGRIVGLSGGTPTHSLISANIIGELGNGLRGTPYRVYDSHLRIRVPGTTLYTYPDLSVVCGDLQFDPQDRGRTTVTNPRLLVEVESVSSAGIDRLLKFDRYLTIESLQEYMLVGQTGPYMQTFFRHADGTWVMTPASGRDAVAKLRSLEVELPLAEVYAGVEFPPEPGQPDADGMTRF